MGRVLAPYGVRGWLKVRPETEQPESLLSYRTWRLAAESGWRDYRLAEGRVHGGSILVARLEGVVDRDQAARLQNMPIAVPRSALPPAPEGEYYWADLIGLAVVNREGVELGVVDEMFATGANDVLVVRGDRERLIPFIESVVVEVDLRGSRLTVDWGAEY
jgi:16S rRNA processing protein RimM